MTKNKRFRFSNNDRWTVDGFREVLTELSRKNKKHLEKLEALNKENKQLRIKIVTHLKEYLKWIEVMSVMAENERYVVDDAGTLIDIQTGDTYDYVSDVCDVLNEKDKSIKILTNHNKEYVRSINILEDKLKKLKELEKENQELLKIKEKKSMTEDIFDEFFSKYNNNYIMSFFKYKDGICEINISEYDYPKSKFNLKDEMELKNFIKTINVLYDLCDDDRIRYDDEANTEYYKRDKIVSLVQEELNEQDRQLTLNKYSPVEYERIIAKIELLNKLQKEIKDVLYMW